MNRAEMFWAQTLDALDGKSDGAEGAIVEGLRILREASREGRKVRSWVRGRIFTVSVERGSATLVGRGADLLSAIERLGYHEAH